jgi:C_GCAxxG_C_C family probable redox protein
MNQKATVSKKAVVYFHEGYNCAQSVLLAISEYWNIRNDLIPKIASGFGGGIGRCGSVCGALTGGVMAIGIRYGTNESSLEKRLRSYELAQSLCRRFNQRHGSMLCRELISFDLSNAKERERARKAGVFEEKCPEFIRTAVELLFDLSEC